jgi:16S rRNA processing protein RimM
MTREDCLLLGTIAKTRGVRGELVLRLKNPTFEPEEDWESLFLQIDGILVPFFIAWIQVIRAEEWIICFEDYESKDEVLGFVGADVWIHKDLLEVNGDEVYFEGLEGYKLTNVRTGKEGLIKGFVDIPGNPLFEVLFEDNMLLIPAREELVTGIDRENQQLSMDLPQGLM